MNEQSTTPRVTTLRTTAGTLVTARRCPVYVCPKTGILRRTPVQPRKKKRKR